MIATTHPICSYRVDEKDCIAFVDHWWLAFARENGAASLTEELVLGRSIWDFICDKPTQLLYNEVHAHVRATNKAILIPFRCDSPTMKRFMELKIRPYPNGQLEYESRLLQVVPQHHVSALDHGCERSQAFLTMCSVCKRSLIEPSGWLDLQNISLKLRTFEQATPQLRYTICPECSSTCHQVRSPLVHSANLKT